MYTDLGAVHEYEKHYDDSLSFAGFSRLSLSMQGGIRESGKVEGSIDIMSLYGLYAGNFNRNSSATLFKVNSVPLTVQLRTLYLSLYLPFADIRIGRQIVNFGKGKILSPLDVFSTIDLADITFRRSGTDLVSLSFPIGQLSGIDVLAQIPLEKQTTIALKSYTSINNVDVSAITMFRTASDEIIAGLGYKGDLIAGFYGELVGHFYPRAKGRNTSVNVMLGADYSFNHSLILSLEYQYNTPSITFEKSSMSSPEKLFTPFTRKQYLYFDTRYIVNDLNTIGGYVLCNIQDRALLGTILYTCNILQNTNLTIYIQGVRGDLYGAGAKTFATASFHYGTALEMKF
jgi:hypothetical protein